MSISIYKKNNTVLQLTVEDELSSAIVTEQFDTPYFRSNSSDPIEPAYFQFNSLTRYLNTFSNPNTYLQDDSGILSPGLLHVSKDHLIFERPPCYQTLFVIPEQLENINYENNSQKIYRIPIPWQLYFVSFNDKYYTTSVSMFFMNSSLLSSDQELYLPPLTNLYINAQLCRPMFNDMEDIEKYSKDIAGVMHSAHDWVWQSGSNLDLTMNFVRYFQQFSADKENTIFDQNIVPDATPLHVSAFTTFATGAYYTSGAHINRFLELWEQVPLNLVSSLRWPSPSKFSAPYTEIQHYRDNYLSDYIEHIRSSSQTSTQTDCCEDCVAYDDYEDTYVNTEDCDCDCHREHIELTLSQENQFYYWSKMLPYQPLTFDDCYKLFLQNANIDLSQKLVFKNPYSFLQSLQSQILYFNH